MAKIKINRKNILLTLKQGTIRDKIKLYFTDMALFNVINMYDVEIKDIGETSDPDEYNLTEAGRGLILTPEEKATIVNSLKKRNDIKYFEDLARYNQSFLLFRYTINTYKQYFKYLTTLINKATLVRILHKQYESTINNILEGVEDVKLREELVKKALKSLKTYEARRYQDKSFLPIIEIPDSGTSNKLIEGVKELNQATTEAKEYIEILRYFLKKHLPLQPYLAFLKEAENEIKKQIKENKELIKKYVLKPLEKENKNLLKIEEEKYKIVNWEDVTVNIDLEEIEDLKNAGG